MKTILIIDDDDAALGIYATALETAGYRVLTAAAGAAGVELARRHLPDVVLSDINMPGMDGRNVLKVLREDAEMGPKQIVLMTGNTHNITTRTAMELGADDFLAKPFTIAELLRCIEARLQRARLHWRVDAKIVTDLRATLRSTLPHEFFTPLAGMLGLVEVLRGDLGQLSPHELTELLDNIEFSGWRLHRTLKNYLLALDLESGATADAAGAPVLLAEHADYAVNAGIDTAVRRHKREADLTRQIAAGPIVGAAANLTTIVEELVENACSFSRPGTPIRVECDARGVLRVTDQGRGMTAEQIEQVGLFRQFDRKKYEQQGLGLGLVLVRKLAEKCGATVTLESQAGHGTTARVAFAPAQTQA
jgi:signal transduction histidine kinase